jgi:hypothetical protein
MAPKRKQVDAGKSWALNKSKTEKKPVVSLSEDDAARTEVPWVLPTQSKKDTESDQSEAVTQYAGVLYNQPWNSIRTSERPLRFPPFRTPLYKTKGGKDLDGSEFHQSSASFRGLFNIIKRDTETKGDDAARRYTRDAFNQAFAEEGNSAAVVASRSIDNYVLALGQDYRVDV